FNLCSQCGFTHRDRHSHVDIVAFAAKHRVLLGANDDVEIARRPAAASGVAFARNPNALAITRSRFDTHFQRFSYVYDALTMAVGTFILDLSCPVTARARHVELHAPTGLRHLSCAFAVGTRLS